MNRTKSCACSSCFHVLWAVFICYITPGCLCAQSAWRIDWFFYRYKKQLAATWPCAIQKLLPRTHAFIWFCQLYLLRSDFAVIEWVFSYLLHLFGFALLTVSLQPQEGNHLIIDVCVSSHRCETHFPFITLPSGTLDNIMQSNVPVINTTFVWFCLYFDSGVDSRDMTVNERGQRLGMTCNMVEAWGH